jgi:hypothetical protein
MIMAPPNSCRFTGNSQQIESILKAEIARNQGGRIDLERLMTRLDGGMPQDDEDVLAVLLKHLKRILVNKLTKAKEGNRFADELAAFAQYCTTNKINCVTFNYDDVLDEALASLEYTYKRVENSGAVDERQDPHWNLDSGYGFYCRPSLISIGRAFGPRYETPDFLLLKLHGSINWRVRRGAARPYTIDDLVHHETWHPEYAKPHLVQQFNLDLSVASLHLEHDPFIVSPVLYKAELRNQPILTLVWAWAQNVLTNADEVTFVGYSMPVTDFAGMFLFSESIKALAHSRIKVVNFARTDAEKKALIQAYRKVFPKIGEKQFDFRGAIEWSNDIVGTTK